MGKDNKAPTEEISDALKNIVSQATLQRTVKHHLKTQSDVQCHREAGAA